MGSCETGMTEKFLCFNQDLDRVMKAVPGSSSQVIIKVNDRLLNRTL